MKTLSRAYVFLPLAYIATGLFIGASLNAVSDGQKKKVPRVLQANHLEIVDSKGRPRILLNTADDADQNATITIKQPDGESTVLLNMPMGTLMLGDDKKMMGISTNDVGEPIFLYGNKKDGIRSINVSKLLNDTKSNRD